MRTFRMFIRAHRNAPEAYYRYSIDKLIYQSEDVFIPCNITGSLLYFNNHYSDAINSTNISHKNCTFLLTLHYLNHCANMYM